MGSVVKTGMTGSAYLAKVNKSKEDVASRGISADGAKERQQVQNRDMVEIAEEGTENIDWKQKAQEKLEEIKKKYGNVSCTEGKLPNGMDLKQLAAQLGPGAHLIISKEFMDRMGASEEDYYECSEILTEIFKQLSLSSAAEKASGAILSGDQVTFWSVPKKKEEILDTLKKQQEETSNNTVSKMMEALKENKSSKDYRYSVSPGAYDTAGNYSSLAKAGSRTAVNRVMGDVRRNISSLSLVACLGDDEDRPKARAAMRSLQKLLVRGHQKLGRLRREELLAVRQKRARERNLERQEQQIRLELKKKRMERSTADGAIELEGRLDSQGISWQKRRLDRIEELRDRLESGAYMGGVEPVGGSIPEMPAGQGGGFTAESVEVSEAISF